MSRKLGNRVLLGLLVGAVVGIIFNLWGPHPIRDRLLSWVFEPVGQVFLRSLVLVVAPLILSSLAIGVFRLGSRDLGRLGGRLVVYYLATSLVAILIGQVLVNAIHPGEGIPSDLIESSRTEFEKQVESLKERSSGVGESLWPGLLFKIVPNNFFSTLAESNMLGILFLSLVLGFALIRIDQRKTESLRSVLEAITDVSVIVVGWIMWIAPFAVAALMVNVVSRMGAGILANLAQYVGVVLLGFVIHYAVTYGVALRMLCRMSLREFVRKASDALITAFSTSSSNATMPTSIKVLEEKFKVSPQIASFSVPLGATVNMDGTALFEVVAALFIAQVFGIEISLVGQISLVLLVLITSVGVAGVPGGSIPILMSAMAMLGIPPEGIALVLGVDRLLDMCRTVVNVSGDLVGAVYLGRIATRGSKAR